MMQDFTLCLFETTKFSHLFLESQLNCWLKWHETRRVETKDNRREIAKLETEAWLCVVKTSGLKQEMSLLLLLLFADLTLTLNVDPH